VPLEIVRNDITKMTVDAIVNAANRTLLGGGGVDGSIHRAAGKGLLEECKTLGGCETGEAKITKGYDLPAKYVIHTVGPVWQGGGNNEEELLRSCYRRSLALAREYSCETVAFPLISSGVYRYPKDKALRVAVDTVSEFLMLNDMTVFIVIFDRASYKISEKLFNDIEEFIDDNYVDEHAMLRRTAGFTNSGILSSAMEDKEDKKDSFRSFCAKEAPCGIPYDAVECSIGDADLDSLITELDESFSQMLLRKIDESGMTDSQCYKKANIDRRLFSKIRNDPDYKPGKTTAIAFAIALELPIEETHEMLRKAGFALSRSNKFDVIIEYFITRGNYNIFEINEALFAFDQSLLGA